MTGRLITSLTNPTVKFLRALHLKKTREESGLFLAEGLKIVIEALDCGQVPEIMLHTDDPAGREPFERARAAVLEGGGEVIAVTRDILEKVSRRDNPQTVIGVFRQSSTPLEAVLATDPSLLVCLEQVRDPGNLGTIIRTVDAAGAGGVVLIGDTVDPFSVEAVRATMGSVFAVPIVRTDLSAFLAWRRTFPGSVVGTRLTAVHDFRRAPWTRPSLILLGAEQSGLSDPAAAACDLSVKIPMRGRADSLNLAVAAGVMIYAALDGLERSG